MEGASSTKERYAGVSSIKEKHTGKTSGVLNNPEVSLEFFLNVGLPVFSKIF